MTQLRHRRIVASIAAFMVLLPGAVLRPNGAIAASASAAAFQRASPRPSQTKMGPGRRLVGRAARPSSSLSAMRYHGRRRLSSSSSGDDGGSASASPSFYDRLGRPRTVVAPMVAQSDLAFRLLTRRHGADLAYTQMIHATNFCRDEYFRTNHLDVYPRGAWDAATVVGTRVESQVHCLEGCPEASDAGAGAAAEFESSYAGEGGPVIVQLAGHEPEVVSSAALRILDRAGGSHRSDLVGFDLNLGCPQSIARKGRYGAFLMEESVDLVCSVLSRLRSDLPSDVGVSAKVRLPNLPESTPPDETERELVERVHKLIDAGVDLITVHGRTLKENKTRVRGCNWSAVRLAAETARSYSGDPSYPVVANGGIEYPSDVTRCLDTTGASAAMSSEALLENPGLFAPGARDDAAMSPREIFNRQVGFANEYLDLAVLYPPLPGSLGKTGGSFNVVRSHLFKMLYRYFEEDPLLRDRLAHGDTTSVQHARRILDDLRGRYATLDDDEWEGLPSSRRGGGGGPASSWYRRYRDAQKRVHTRGDAALNERRAAADDISVDDKKRAMRERIRKLKEERERKEGGTRASAGGVEVAA
mmetsp:Transcript_24763/g.72524  ORF Transcript_24763/g.72524 Transcript_24763/m.72524 type:complete len:587 (-) Transcript_24763:310-2070(-)